MCERAKRSRAVRLNTKVEVAEKVGGGWKLTCSATGDTIETKESYELHTPKIILSTGLASRAAMPAWARSPSSDLLIVHSATFPQHFNTIVQPSKHTLVIGAGKSAWDVAYACATQPDASATMLIRPSGKGPIWQSPPFVTPLKKQLEKLVFTRFLGLFSPCPWADNTGFEGWVRRFLHGTWLGRKIVGKFWSILAQDVVELNQFNNHPETKKLRPWRDAFEVGNGLSILNYPTNWFDLVREGKIKVIIAEVSGLQDGNKVHLSDGQTLEVDAVVCATGWESGPSIQFLPEGLEKDLGLPSTGPRDNEDERALIAKADAELYARYPFLQQRNRNKIYHPDPARRVDSDVEEKTEDPYRLYRFMVPPAFIEERSVGFVGAMITLGNSSCAYIQSLWMTAYLDGSLPAPYQKTCSRLMFDSLSYLDVVLRDLWLKGKRRGGIGEYMRPYGPEDYRGLVDEYCRLQKLVRNG